MNSEKIFSFLGKVSVVIASAIIGIAITEIAFRAFNLESNQILLLAPLESRYPRPYVESAAKPGWHGSNSLGYIGKLPAAKKDKEIRIFLIGGSTVAGGSPPFPQILESLIHEAGYKGVAVYNFGVTSSVSGQDLSRIVFDISRFSPDLIIQYAGGNDIDRGIKWDPRPGYPINYLLEEYNPLLRLLRNDSNSVLAALSSLRVFRAIFAKQIENNLFHLQTIRSEQLAFYGSQENLNNAAYDEFLRHASLSQKFTKALGAEYILIFQPLRDFYLDGNNELKDAKNYILNQKTSRNLGIVDFSNLFETERTSAFIDRIHIHQQYQVRVAEEIYRELNKRNFFRSMKRASKTQEI